MSPYMRSILEIVNSSPQLQHDLMPIINVQEDMVYLSLVNRGALCGSTQSCLAWIAALWTDKVDPQFSDLFWNFESLNKSTKLAIIRAIQIKYNI